MDVWKNECVKEEMCEIIDVRNTVMHVWMNGCVDEWMCRRIDVWTNVCVDEWMCISVRTEILFLDAIAIKIHS